MTKFLVNRFVKDPEHINNTTTRQQYGFLSGIVGIFINLSLFFAKLLTGISLQSVSIIADSFNNLSDMGSSLVTLFGFKMSSKPPDKEHPFGHGRGEYITAFILSFVILLLGYEFIQSSVSKIINPSPIKFSWVSVGILSLTVAAKIWLCIFNKYLGKTIFSNALLAVSKDSRNDVFITTATIFSLLFSHLTGIVIDGYVGIFVACIILYTGYEIAKETLSNLLGESVDANLLASIKSIVLNTEGILGVHDLIVHNYGPNKLMGTLHAEIADNVPLEQAHKAVDYAERKIAEELGVLLVIHMDPVALHDEKLATLTNICQTTLLLHAKGFESHDHRLLRGALVQTFMFDLEVPFGSKPETIVDILNQLKKEVKHFDADCQCVANVEYGYANGTEIRS